MVTAEARLCSSAICSEGAGLKQKKEAGETSGDRGNPCLAVVSVCRWSTNIG